MPRTRGVKTATFFSLKNRILLLLALAASLLVYQAQKYHDAILVKSDITQALNIVNGRHRNLEKAWAPFWDPDISLPSIYITHRECSRALEHTQAAIQWYGDYHDDSVHYAQTAVAFKEAVRRVIASVEDALSIRERLRVKTDEELLFGEMLKGVGRYVRPTWLYVRQECNIRDKAWDAVRLCRDVLSEQHLERIRDAVAPVCRRS